jgi:predicted nucleic acid-binding protein
MNYVLDASVAIKWVLIEQDTDKAHQIRDNARNGIDHLIAPDFFPVECGHALFRAERRKLIAAGDAARGIANILADCPSLRDSLALFPRAIAICDQLRCGFFDAIYVALGEAEGYQVVTADTRLLAIAQASFPFVIALSSIT